MLLPLKKNLDCRSGSHASPLQLTVFCNKEIRPGLNSCANPERFELLPLWPCFSFVVRNAANSWKSQVHCHCTFTSSGLITVAGKLRKQPPAGKAGRSHLETNFCPQRIAIVLSYCACISAKGNKQDVPVTCLYIERLPTVQLRPPQPDDPLEPT